MDQQMATLDENQVVSPITESARHGSEKPSGSGDVYGALQNRNISLRRQAAV